jgi:hypothetical protein
VSAAERQVWFQKPRLPSFVPELRIANLEVGDATLDLLLTRRVDDVGVRVLRRAGDVSVVVAR